MDRHVPEPYNQYGFGVGRDTVMLITAFVLILAVYKVYKWRSRIQSPQNVFIQSILLAIGTICLWYAPAFALLLALQYVVLVGSFLSAVTQKEKSRH